jgi:hypothetical protein
MNIIKKKKIFSIKNNTNTFLKRYKHDKRINYDTNQGSKTSVCGGESLAGQLLCRNNLTLCFFFFYGFLVDG